MDVQSGKDLELLASSLVDYDLHERLLKQLFFIVSTHSGNLRSTELHAKIPPIDLHTETSLPTPTPPL